MQPYGPYEYYGPPIGAPSDAMAMVEENRQWRAQDPAERPETEFGRQFFQTLGIQTTGGDPRDEQETQVFYGHEPPDDAWERQSGHQRRVLLSDWVRGDDPRRFDGHWDPEEGYLFDYAPDEGENGTGGLGLDAQNLDGLLGLNDINDPEMRQALAYKAQSEVLEPKEVEGLTKRFLDAQSRAMRHEDTEIRKALQFPKKDWSMPTAAARKLNRDRRRVLRVFDPDTRLRDAGRAVVFYQNHPECSASMIKAIGVTFETSRKQYGDYLADLLYRIKLAETTPDVRAKLTARPRQQHYKEVPQLRRHVGRVIDDNNSSPPIIAHTLRHHSNSSKRRISSLDTPVLSRAKWTITSVSPPTNNAVGDRSGSSYWRDDDGNGEDDDENEGGYQQLGGVDINHNKNNNSNNNDDTDDKTTVYFERGNTHFLAARLGLVSRKAQTKARQDALKFFEHRFGLDFSPKSGAKQDSSTLAIHHATLPLVLEPYTVSPRLRTQIEFAEGNLGSPTTAVASAGASVVTAPASSSSSSPDRLVNGFRNYEEEGTMTRTSVSEAGWIVRNNSKKAVELPVRTKTPVRLPRGGVLVTGFWVLERPDAPSAILRFQSARPPQVISQRLALSPARQQRASQAPRTKSNITGVRYQVVSRWDLYDMAHDCTRRPTKGIGQGISVLQMDWFRKPAAGTQRYIKHKTETCRTMVTIHH